MQRAQAFVAATSIRASAIGEKYEILGAACTKCGSQKRIFRTSSRRGNGTGWRCATRRCDRPWPIRYGYDHAASGGSRRSTPANLERLVQFCDLGLKLRGLTVWQMRVLESYASTVGQPGRRIDLVVQRCRERWPRRRDGWSTEKVRGILDQAHRRVEANISKTGIFDEGE